LSTGCRFSSWEFMIGLLLQVYCYKLVVNFLLGGHVYFESVILDLRKIPQSEDMSHKGFSGLFGHFRTGNLEVRLYLVFEKILQSGDISNRGFIRIVES